MLKLDKSSTAIVFVKNYKIKISKSDFTHIHVYLCRVSFLTTLKIYKDYFKGRHNVCKLMKLDANVLFKQIVTGDKFALVHVSLEEAVVFVRRRIL